ncbi:hypothetical protein GIB67_025227 [Kingdonia uniflora]|uniref:Glycosyltransferases n=1 Tax=Kingdonia uniflora TaxID=39325 RepID=A0A7J7L148_9MAGN|nr:hypothetical protein GIB67_025227 [Kingdonia uniflora]
MYRHLMKKSTNVKDRGVHQRNIVLEHIGRHKLDGIVYFAEDDNIYSLELFESFLEISYDDSHAGHARASVIFDVLVWYLTHLGYEVIYVRNVTDIDDKIIKRANLKKEDPLLLSNEYCQKFMEVMADLQCLPPTHKPRVLTHMDQIKQMIATANMDYHPLVVRYFLMSAHYCSHMDYTKEQLEIASDSVNYNFQKKPQPSVFQSFDALESEIKELLKILGLLWPPSYLEIFESLKEKALKRANLKLDYVLQKIEERVEARKHRDYLKVDEIRRDLASKGIIFMDEGEKTVWRPMRPSVTPQ